MLSNTFPIDDDRTTNRAKCRSIGRRNQAGLISRDGPQRGRQGGIILMTSSRTPNMEPAHAAERLRGRPRGRLLLGVPAGGDNPRSHVNLIGLGLSALVVSTTWAIASVSVWWVPVYLGLLVGIFVTPRRRKSTSSVSTAGGRSGSVGVAELVSGQRVDCGDGIDDIRSLAQFDSGQTNGKPTEPMDFSPNLTTASSDKRRGRVRARKAGKPASESSTHSFPVAWIQVGPGKFVRVEDGIQAVNSAPIQETASRVCPATETPAEATPTAAAPTELPSEQESFTLSGSSCGDVELISHSDDRNAESVTEEHGIAPTAFSLATRYESFGESPDRDLEDEIAPAEVELTQSAEPDIQLPPTQTAPPGLRGQLGASREWTSRIRRGIVLTVPRASRARSQRVTRTSPNPRLLVGTSCSLARTPRDPTRRAFGRVLRLHGMLRTRSPPC